MRIGNKFCNASISKIKHKIDINNFQNFPATSLCLNDISEVEIRTDQIIPFDNYHVCKETGSFILIDKVSYKTVAAGMINHPLRRASNIHFNKLEIDKKARRSLNGHTSKVLWFTGLSGSGKTTIANELEQKLYKMGIRTYILDGDNIRHGLNSDLGFTKADRVENIRRIGEVSKLMLDAGIVVLTSFISPFKREREMVRSLFKKSEFIEIFVDTPIEVAEKRDPKGLYKKAREGKLPNFTGIDSPYEEPESPDIHLKTVGKSVKQLVTQIIKYVDFKVL